MARTNPPPPLPTPDRPPPPLNPQTPRGQAKGWGGGGRGVAGISAPPPIHLAFSAEWMGGWRPEPASPPPNSPGAPLLQCRRGLGSPRGLFVPTVPFTLAFVLGLTCAVPPTFPSRHLYRAQPPPPLLSSRSPRGQVGRIQWQATGTTTTTPCLIPNGMRSAHESIAWFRRLCPALVTHTAKSPLRSPPPRNAARLRCKEGGFEGSRADRNRGDGSATKNNTHTPPPPLCNPVSPGGGASTPRTGS